MQTEKTLIGYRVVSRTGAYVLEDGQTTTPNNWKPTPVSQSDAYKAIAAYVGRFPGIAVPSVVKVFRVRELTPMETTSNECADLLFSLLGRHGLDLGITKDQAASQFAKELAQLGSVGTAMAAAALGKR
jgi:hypothetical protein